METRFTKFQSFLDEMHPENANSTVLQKVPDNPPTEGQSSTGRKVAVIELNAWKLGADEEGIILGDLHWEWKRENEFVSLRVNNSHMYTCDMTMFTSGSPTP